MIYAAFGFSTVIVMAITFWITPLLANLAVGKKYQWKQIVLDLMTIVTLVATSGAHFWLWRYLLGDLAR